MSNQLPLSRYIDTLSRLCSRQDLNDYVRNILVPRLMAYQPDHQNIYLPAAPMFGVLTDVAQTTNFYAYDHPALLVVAKNAFTDGINVYFAAPFLDRLLKEEQEALSQGRRREGVLAIGLHELCHKARMHLGRERFSGEDPKMANIAMDFLINATIHIDFGLNQKASGAVNSSLSYDTGDAVGRRFEWTTTFSEAWGMDDPEKWSRESEESILDWMNKNGGKERFAPPSQMFVVGPGVGKGGGHPEGGDPSSDAHVITTEELSELLSGTKEDRELRDALGIPKPGDKKEHRAQARLAEREVEAAVKAAKERSLRSSGPGRHLDTWLYRELQRKYESHVDYRLALKHGLIVGAGRTRHTLDEPGPLRGMDISGMGLTAKLWLGDRAPIASQGAVVCIIDTSGSVDDSMLGDFVAEAVGIIKQNPTKVGKLLLYSADSALRDEAPFVVTPLNWRAALNQFKAKGGGGTDMTAPLAATFGDPEWVKKYKPRAAFVFTDLEIPPIDRAALPTIMPPTFFMGPEGADLQSSRKAVGDWANVVLMKKGAVVDVDAAERASSRRSGQAAPAR